MNHQNVYVCNECARCCKSTNQFQCQEQESIWHNSARHQITEVPEPVYVLDIPKMTQSNIAGFVAMLNQLSETGEPLTLAQLGVIEMNFQENIPSDWLKQKQPEPTREELQERLDRIVRILGDPNVLSVRGENIYKLATGEK